MIQGAALQELPGLGEREEPLVAVGGRLTGQAVVADVAPAPLELEPRPAPAVGQGDDEPAARHPGQLPEHLVEVVQVLQDVGAHHGVEVGLGEGQPLRPLQVQGQVAPLLVDAGVVGPVQQPPEIALVAADVEHLAAQQVAVVGHEVGRAVLAPAKLGPVNDDGGCRHPPPTSVWERV